MKNKNELRQTSKKRIENVKFSRTDPYPIKHKKQKPRSSRKFQKMKGEKQKWIKTNKQKCEHIENDRINNSNEEIKNSQRARPACNYER